MHTQTQALCPYKVVFFCHDNDEDDDGNSNDDDDEHQTGVLRA